MNPHDFSIYNILKRNAVINRDKIAWICDNEELTYGRFLENTDNVAFGLASNGIEKGDRIAVIGQNSMAYVYLFFAAAKIGAIMLPVNIRLSEDEIEYIINDGSPKIIFADDDFQGFAGKLSEKYDFVEKLYGLESVDGIFARFDTLTENHGTCSAHIVLTDDAFVIIHTAAIAGKPRGAVISHNNLLMASLQAVNIWQMTSEDRHLCLLPFFHIAGLGLTLDTILVGGINILMPKFDAEMALRHIEDNRATIFFDFPPILSTLLENNKKSGRDLSSLRIVTGLESPEIIKNLEGTTPAKFWTGYGQSETTGFITNTAVSEKPGSTGVPCYFSEVNIIDEQGEPVETGIAGEIAVRGPMVFKGYWNLENDTADTFRGGWHHTGDKGKLDDNGYLYYVGRMPEKELIKPGGENVYPAEVEKTILEVPQIKEVSVIGVHDDQWGEAVKAICVLKEGERLSESEVIDHVASKIARYKKPKYIVFVDELPKSEDGSIDRDKVKSTLMDLK
ncbi:MAG: AMP-binding protein [Desulfobacterales bacterium]|nr:AMP-binding protein [Desulfobacterales bacterium]